MIEKLTSFSFSMLFMLISLQSCSQKDSNVSGESYSFDIKKTEEQWKKELSELEYEVLREEGTERAFSGKYVDWENNGIFQCKACNNPVFHSKTKFKSGTGWPSFYEPIKKKAILEKSDNKYGWDRVEVECGKCGSHLGHVFNDGPEPTGLRYCINSVALSFSEKE